MSKRIEFINICKFINIIYKRVEDMPVGKNEKKECK
jgi:hypothetical protein